MASNKDDIDSEVKELQSRKKAMHFDLPDEAPVIKPKPTSSAQLGVPGSFDQDIYTAGNRFEQYDTTIAASDDIEEDEDEGVGPAIAAPGATKRKPGYTAPINVLSEGIDQDADPFAETRRPRVGDRNQHYNRKERVLSPAHHYDPFQEGGKTPAPGSVTYAEIMRSQKLAQDKAALQKQAIEKLKAGEVPAGGSENAERDSSALGSAAGRRRRWDQPTTGGDTAAATTAHSDGKAPEQKKSRAEAGAAASQWDEAESQLSSMTPASRDVAITPGHGLGGETPGAPVTHPATRIRMWDPTPAHSQFPATPSRAEAEATPGHGAAGEARVAGSARRNRWDEATPGQTPRVSDTPSHLTSGFGETPRADRGDDNDRAIVSETPTPSASKRKSRWDEQTPLIGGQTPQTPRGIGATPAGIAGFTPSGGATPSGLAGFTPSGFLATGATPSGAKAMAMQTPTPGQMLAMTPEQMQLWNMQRELDERNRPLTDEELDTLLPATGYKILQPPAGYIPIRTPGRKLLATPTPMVGGTPAGFKMMGTPEVGGMKASAAGAQGVVDLQPPGENMPLLKPDDLQYFDKLLTQVEDEALSKEDQRDRKIMTCLLRIKNGTPPMRKSALRQLTENARTYGAGALFNQILPLLMSPTLEDQERHLLVKTIDRVLYKLDDLVRPFVHKILVVIEPLLIDEDYYARVEGREIISNLAKAAGLATMISTMRPDIDNMDEYVRNATARAFAVVASSLGIPALLPFLKAVCKSKKSWQARHTGIKIVQQIAILLGCAVLPYLKQLVEIIGHGLEDEQQKVRTISALSIAALAEAAAPYGIECFDTVLMPLWKGIRQHRGKGLAAFLKAIGFLIPLMDAEYANYYTREVMLILIREFQSPDEEMKKIVLKVVKQCCATDGVEPSYIKSDVLTPFFKNFWNQRMAMDKRNYKQLVETTVEIAAKVGAAEMIARIVEDLKDESEQYRKMVMDTIEKILASAGASAGPGAVGAGTGVAGLDSRLEEQLVDGVVYAFQEQTTEEPVMLHGFATVVNALGKRCKPYLPQIAGTILWRLNNKSPKVRQQAADLVARIAPVMKLCQEEKLMGHLGVVLYEYLGEEYPEVLGSILGGLKGIVVVIGVNKMNPPIKDLLPRLTPILKNRHEKVQENCIELVGRIAERGAEMVSAREWMRICFELLELLKAHKKAIRRAAINTFGYIARAIGPHDVLATLLNNLKVQERQMRVCTTVAIAIVAETCSPFTVIPALMNEYRVPELNVQHGVLKALAFMCEYIGEMCKDYVYALTPLLVDALMERDLVHRQIALACTGQMALGVFGFGCEDALQHMLNLTWPNFLENAPHCIQTFILAIEGLRLSLGPAILLNYALTGLFHPSRKVRNMYWKIYNLVYIGRQDALVAFYPRLPSARNLPALPLPSSEGEAPEPIPSPYESCERDYTRYELEYIL